ncbi:MAG: YkgJ family cysteine cluster protein [Candidatus Freyarchaeota archaeon]|nr:YkgJ family cysteine cluster protein [Candidatus Jordarchaeia archaeon]
MVGGPVPFLPWRLFHSWSCLMCGECCEKFDVSLTPPEASLLVREYGEKVVEKRGRKIYLRRVGGKCVFQDRVACSIQTIKPSACKLWPFKVSSYPLRLEDRHMAEYTFAGTKLYVYVNVFCRGLNKGTPIWAVIPEAVAIHFGLTDKQTLTTSQVPKAIETKPTITKTVTAKRAAKRK